MSGLKDVPCSTAGSAFTGTGSRRNSSGTRAWCCDSTYLRKQSLEETGRLCSSDILSSASTSAWVLVVPRHTEQHPHAFATVAVQMPMNMFTHCSIPDRYGFLNHGPSRFQRLAALTTTAAISARAGHNPLFV